MTETEAGSLRPLNGLDGILNPSLAEGWSQILLLTGMTIFAIGTLVSIATAVGVGASIIVIAFLLNTIGKLVHYRRSPMAIGATLIVSGTWVLLTIAITGAVVTYTWARYGWGGGDGYFWPLAVAGFGFGLLHMAAQARLLTNGDPDL